MPSSTRSLRPAPKVRPYFTYSPRSRDTRFVRSSPTQAPRGTQDKICIAVQTITLTLPITSCCRFAATAALLLSLSLSLSLSIPNYRCPLSTTSSCSFVRSTPARSGSAQNRDLEILVLFVPRLLKLHAELKTRSCPPSPSIPSSPLSPLLHLLLLLLKTRFARTLL